MSMTQLDNFREQLKQRSHPAQQEVRVEQEAQETASPSQKRLRKKTETPRRKSVWLSTEAVLKAKTLALWVETENIDTSSNLGDLFAEALDCLIETKYPKAKAYMKGRK